MIYTASYFQPKNHHGQVISISRSTPKGITVDGSLPFLAPPADLLRDWDSTKKAGNPMPWEEYTARYKVHFARGLAEFKTWLSTLTPDQDVTLCCWEKAGDNCHRNLVGIAVQKFAPELWGGADVPKVEQQTMGIPIVKTEPETKPQVKSLKANQVNALKPETNDSLAPGTSVIVDTTDWITGEPFSFEGVVESLKGGGYMVTSDEPRSRYGIFAKGKVSPLR